MSWQDRLREAAYTPPSGKRLTFDYEDVSVTFEQKTSAYDFADANGTYVQSLGRTGRQIPMRFIFWGENYDVEAANFQLALAEDGDALLEHPAYGEITVVPRGPVHRTDALKNAANQAVIEVTLWETTGVIYPSAEGDAAAEVARAITDFNAAGAGVFAQNLSVSDSVEKALANNAFARALDKVRGGLRTVADTQAEVQKTFEAIDNSINDTLDTLIGQPLTLAFQTSLLIQAPARSIALISDKLKAYHNLAKSLFVPAKKGEGNAFNINYLTASNALMGQVVSVTETQFTTRTEALLAADAVLNLAEELTTWQDASLATLSQVDTGEAYQAALRAARIVAGYLVEISFTLLKERVLVLDRARSLIDLSAEIYGSVAKDKLDLLINTNSLTGEEILELPRGREIVYYDA